MNSKLPMAIVMIAVVAAVGTMTTSTNINAFAQTDPEQLQKNCRHGNQMACNVLKGDHSTCMPWTVSCFLIEFLPRPIKSGEFGLFLLG